MKNKKTKKINLTHKQIICIFLAVKYAYLETDQEYFCEETMSRCGKCSGCLHYKNLFKAYKLVEGLIPNIKP